LLGGKITVDSEYGVGSNFSLFLPSGTINKKRSIIESNEPFTDVPSLELSEKGSSFDHLESSSSAISIIHSTVNTKDTNPRT